MYSLPLPKDYTAIISVSLTTSDQGGFINCSKIKGKVVIGRRGKVIHNKKELKKVFGSKKR